MMEYFIQREGTHLPELPEVETTCRGIEPHLVGVRVLKVVIRQPKLRWPVPMALQVELSGEVISSIKRRGKYLIFHSRLGSLISHLGMSGSFRILSNSAAPKKHDHVDFILENGKTLRYNDPRRFGCILWEKGDAYQHPLLSGLGPEPLSAEFNKDVLFKKSRNRKTSVKTFIMDSKTVVGVGNIYANEALFSAGIHPKRLANRVSKKRYVTLTHSIKQILLRAVSMGGTTLRDFTNEDGKPGYFSQSLQVYGRARKPCIHCATTLKEIRINQRSTVYCSKCQN